VNPSLRDELSRITSALSATTSTALLPEYRSSPGGVVIIESCSSLAASYAGAIPTATGIPHESTTVAPSRGELITAPSRGELITGGFSQIFPN